MRACVGAWHPRKDRVDYPAWTVWYNTLEERFEDAGLAVSRSPSSARAYPAGFLFTEGAYCEGKSCILLAAPASVAMPSGNTNQTAISILSIRRR